MDNMGLKYVGPRLCRFLLLEECPPFDAWPRLLLSIHSFSSLYHFCLDGEREREGEEKYWHPEQKGGVSLPHCALTVPGGHPDCTDCGSRGSGSDPTASSMVPGPSCPLQDQKALWLSSQNKPTTGKFPCLEQLQPATPCRH